MAQWKEVNISGTEEPGLSLTVPSANCLTSNNKLGSTDLCILISVRITNFHSLVKISFYVKIKFLPNTTVTMFV